MAYGVNEIICPYCEHIYAAEGNEVETGVGESEWQCSECEEEFVIISEIYTVDFGIESLTYEERDERQRKQDEKINELLKRRMQNDK